MPLNAKPPGPLHLCTTLLITLQVPSTVSDLQRVCAQRVPPPTDHRTLHVLSSSLIHNPRDSLKRILRSICSPCSSHTLAACNCHGPSSHLAQRTKPSTSSNATRHTFSLTPQCSTAPHRYPELGTHPCRSCFWVLDRHPTQPFVLLPDRCWLPCAGSHTTICCISMHFHLRLLSIARTGLFGWVSSLWHQHCSTSDSH